MKQTLTAITGTPTGGVGMSGHRPGGDVSVALAAPVRDRRADAGLTGVVAGNATTLGSSSAPPIT